MFSILNKTDVFSKSKTKFLTAADYLLSRDIVTARSSALTSSFRAVIDSTLIHCELHSKLLVLLM